jgi:anti-sigma B factor antagonist
MNLKKKELKPGVVVLEITDKIVGLADCERINAEVDLLVRQNQARVIFDLSGVYFIDSSAVGTIVRSFCALKNSGGMLRLAGVKGTVETALQMTQVHKVIGIYQTAVEAAQD